MRLIPIECARVDSVLAQTIYDDNGIVLLKKGVQLSAMVIEKLYSLSIYSIYIDDKYSEIEIRDVIKPELRRKSISIIKETFRSLERFKETDELITKKMLNIVNKDYLQYIHSIAEEMIDEILTNNNVLVSLVDIKSMDNYSYQHAVNVTVISLVIGISLKMKKDELMDLCFGALTHDIGKTFITKDITMKIGHFTEEEGEIYKTHTVKGYEYLKEQLALKDSIIRVALEHHERMDGLGYPKGIKGNEIHKFSKIVAIANTYDGLTSDCSYRKAISAADALEFIMAHVNTLFDFNYVNVFSRIIIAYPEGTIVKLSNGDIGVVTSTPANYPLRPNVKIIKSKIDDKVGKITKLLNQVSIVITSVEYDV